MHSQELAPGSKLTPVPSPFQHPTFPFPLHSDEYASYFSGDGDDDVIESAKKQNMKHLSLFVEGICFIKLS